MPGFEFLVPQMMGGGQGLMGKGMAPIGGGWQPGQNTGGGGQALTTLLWQRCRAGDQGACSQLASMEEQSRREAEDRKRQQEQEALGRGQWSASSRR
jgi:hypothetical protein